MARVFIEGFESGDTSLWDESSYSNMVISSSLMTGDYCLSNFSGYPITLVKNVPARTEYFLSLTVKPTSNSYGSICSFGYNDQAKYTLVRDQTNPGAIRLLAGDDKGTLILSSTDLRGLQLNKKSNIIFHIIVSDAASGSIDVTVNGKSSISVTGLDTINTTGPEINKLIIGSYSGDNTFYGYMDDIVLDDSEPAIRPKIYGLRPASGGTYTGFTPSEDGAENYSLVNETPSDEDTFVLSNIADTKDTYKIGALSPLLTEIKCVQISAQAWYEGNSAVKKLALICKTEVSEVESNIKDLDIYPASYSMILQESPDHPGEQFTVEEIATLEIGMRTVGTV